MSEQQSPAPGPAQAGQPPRSSAAGGAQNTSQGPAQPVSDHQLKSFGLDDVTLQKANALGLGSGALVGLLRKYIPMILTDLLSQLQGGGGPTTSAPRR